MGIEAALAIATLTALCVLFYGPWQSVCTDYARQVIFEKRDVLFDMAARGEIDFGSHQYRTIRASLEKSIRFAHELTLPRFFLFRWHLRRINLKRPESELLDAANSIKDEHTRQVVQRIVIEAHTAMILSAMAKSPLTVLISLFAAILLQTTDGFKRRISKAITPFGEMVQMEAEYAPSRTACGAF